MNDDLTKLTSAVTIQRVSPPGRGALGVLLLQGDRCEGLLAKLFRPTVRRWQARPYYGSFVAPGLVDETVGATDDTVDRIIDDRIIDDGIVMPLGAQRFLLTLHGNPALAQQCIDACIHWGAQAGGEGLNWGDGDSAVEALAMSYLPQAPNAEAAAVLLEQAQHPAGLRHTLDRWMQVPPTLAQLQEVAARAPFGRAFFEAKTVVLLGEPNAGKSTLFNALLGTERVVASAQAGTTRDVIDEVCFLGDYPVRLCDGAGVRDSEDLLEREGVRRILERLQEADLAICLHPPWRLPATLEQAQQRVREIAPGWQGLTLHILSRVDQIIPPEPGSDPSPQTSEPAAVAKIATTELLGVSATTGRGVDELAQRALWALLGETCCPRQVAVPFAPQHSNALQNAIEAVETGLDPRPALVF